VTTVDEAIDNIFLEFPTNGRGDPKRSSLLDRVAKVQRSSASVLRFHGRETEARKAEQAASRIRLTLEEPRATARMFASARTAREAVDYGQSLDSALDGAISLLGADFGNIQLRDPGDGALRIVEQAGFDAEFLEYFATVADDGSACGRAASQRAQVVIVDVDEDEAFAPHRQIAAASRFRAVQSTPLVDSADRLIGVVSTHFRRPHHPSARDLLLIEWYVEQIGDALRSNGKP
jgi:GAF domain-containing protein